MFFQANANSDPRSSLPGNNEGGARRNIRRPLPALRVSAACSGHAMPARASQASSTASSRMAVPSARMRSPPPSSSTPRASTVKGPKANHTSLSATRCAHARNAARAARSCTANSAATPTAIAARASPQ